MSTTATPLIPSAFLNYTVDSVLPEDEDRFTDPLFDVVDADRLVPLYTFEETQPPAVRQTALLFKNVKDLRRQIALYAPYDSPKTGLVYLESIQTRVDAIWEAYGQCFIYLSDNQLFLYNASNLSADLITTLPEHADSDEIDVTWDLKTSQCIAVCFVHTPRSDNPLGLQVYPYYRDQSTLCCFAGDANAPGQWHHIASLHRESSMLSISKNGRLAVWRTFRTFHAEEAERGEFFGCALSFAPDNHAPESTANVVQITHGAGRVFKILASHDGEYLVYACNSTFSKPITTNLNIYYKSWKSCLESSFFDPEYLPGAPWDPNHSKDSTSLPKDSRSLQLLGPDLCVDAFAWMAATGNANLLVFNIITSNHQKTYYIDLDLVNQTPDHLRTIQSLSVLPNKNNPCDNSQLSEAAAETEKSTVKPTKLKTTATSTIVCLDMASNDFVYVSESITDYPHLVTGADRTPVLFDHDPIVHEFTAEKIFYTAKDGQCIEGMLYKKKKSGAEKPALIVHIHGGPAVSMFDFRSEAVRYSRYPYRHLLNAGYDIFAPLYRGTLGYGDKFAGANIRTQGHLDHDLGDIISGVEYLKSQTLYEDRIGVYGGSYGGYMTMRCLSKTDLFKVGVPMYGFIHFRWMSLETWDLTWEHEYSGERIAFPLKDELEFENIFKHLHQIKVPTLLLHGELDDICPVSQSKVAFKALQLQRVPTSLVIYPGERHGFDNPDNKRDVLRRTLLWFKTYLPIQ